MSTFIFKSGIRKIIIEAKTLDQAKKLLENFEIDAWSDKTWNWKIEILNHNQGL